MLPGSFARYMAVSAPLIRDAFIVFSSSPSFSKEAIPKLQVITPSIFRAGCPGSGLSCKNILCDGLPQRFPIAATLFERAGGTPTDSFVSLHLEPLMGMVRRSAAVSGYQESHHAYESPPAP